VRAVEDAVRSAVQQAGNGVGVEPVDDAVDRPQARPPVLRPPGLLELEELLADHLDTRVSVSMAGKKGRVTVDFADLDDLERIYRRMTEPVD
jgi:ParB family chromosome partitioning protein